MSHEARHTTQRPRRAYRSVPVWQDLLLLSLVVVVGVVIFMTFSKYR